jgi:hypothetical protein
MTTTSRLLVVLALGLLACKQEAATPPADSKAPPPAPAAEPAKPAPPPAPVTPIAPRSPGPTVPTDAQCVAYADKVMGFVVESLLPPGSDDAARQTQRQKLTGEEQKQLAFCLSALETKEVECVTKAADYNALAACERWRRQIPDELDKRDKVTEADCERFFVRYRQFMVQDGIPPDAVDKDHAKLVKTCLDKASTHNLACFITAHTYDQAKRCP